MKGKIESILNDESFLEDLKKAIESGKGVDYGYDPDTFEDTAFETFDSTTARMSVIEVLKNHLT